MTADTLAGRLRELAGSKPGVAQAGFVTVSASELERIATDLETLPMLGAWLPTREQLRAMAEQLRDENDFGLRYKPLVADWLDAFATALEAMPSREEIARIIDPHAWALWPDGGAAMPGDTLAGQKRVRAESLAKADAIRALFSSARLPPPPQGGA